MCASIKFAWGGGIYPVKYFDLRDEAYPFDWIESPFSALYQCLVDDFANFLTALKSKRDYLVVDFYGFEFLHDWPTQVCPNFDVANSDFGVGNAQLVSDWPQYNESVRSKYRRRIARFRQSCSGQEKIFFFRYHDITKAQAVLLRDLIAQRYPNLDFELVVVISTEPLGVTGETWELERIKNFYITYYEWGNPQLWGEIFKQLGIDITS
ncbi:MAG TPA: DUF1796 family putative cysteine peptidase [Candidatus Babeliales bacterium]|nr:DUF1796 family putative cysteine peptidase [Candidatus Babeliales bacterium]